MKTFIYKARDSKGATVTGQVESISDSLAAKALQGHGLLVVSISEKRTFSLSSLSIGVSKVSMRDVTTFTRLLSTMLASGLPLTDALSNLGTQFRGGYFREVIRSIDHDVQAGRALSEAMGRFPSVFNNLYVNLVKAGEASGKMDEALERLADTLEADLAFQGKIRGAMVYPAIVVTAMIGIGVLMITTIIPKIADVYKDYSATLPLPTRVLIGFSDLLRNYSIIFVIFAVILFYLYRTLKKNATSEFLINNAMFKLPVFGKLNENVILTSITRTLGTLLGSGIDIIESLKIVANTLSNNKFQAGLLDASRSVEKGLPLSLAIRRDQSFPLMMAQLMAIGEETGSLDQSLMRLSKFYQDAAERQVAVLTTALEPVMILIMGTMVGGLALAILLPMFNLVNVIK